MNLICNLASPVLWQVSFKINQVHSYLSSPLWIKVNNVLISSHLSLIWSHFKFSFHFLCSFCCWIESVEMLVVIVIMVVIVVVVIILVMDLELTLDTSSKFFHHISFLIIPISILIQEDEEEDDDEWILVKMIQWEDKANQIKSNKNDYSHLFNWFNWQLYFRTSSNLQMMIFCCVVN